MKRLFLALLVFACACGPFARSARHGIVNFDDVTYVDDHPEVISGLSLKTVKWAFGTVEDAIWMPFTWLAFAFDRTVADRLHVRYEHVAHAGNVFGHGLNAVLLLFLLATLFGDRGETQTGRVPWLALVGALFWAMHPLRTESVAWIASKKDVLSGFFFLLALLAWVRWRVSGKRPLYAFALLSLVAGACCKPSVMVFVGVVVVLDFFVLGLYPRTWSPRDVKPYVAPFLICLAIAVEAHLAQGAGHALGFQGSIPVWWRLLNAAVSFGIYVLHTLLPLDLACQCVIRYPHLPRLTWIALPLAIAVGVPLYRRLRRWMDAPGATDAVLGGGLWFAGALLPVIGIVGFGFHAFADRFTYIPAMGLSVAGVGAGVRLLGSRRRLVAGPVCVLGCAGVLTALGVLSFRQTGFWRDDRTLWAQTLAVDGDGNAMAHMNLALWHYEYNHGSPETIRHFRGAIRGSFEQTSNVGPLVIDAFCDAGLDKEAGEFLDRMKERNAEIDKVPEGMEWMLSDRKLHWGAYALSRIAYFIHTPILRASGEGELAALLREQPLDRNALYFQGRLLEMKGFPEEASRTFKKLHAEGTGRDAYVRYRFTRPKAAR